MTTPPAFNLKVVHPSWQPCITSALTQINHDYQNTLLTNDHWLPGKDKIFNAFSLPVEKINYILFGESPYPRPQSANGYAFFDAAVTQLWSETGLSKPVNRATSLRNIIKMLLIAEYDIESPTQADIANLDKHHLITTNQELFTNLLNHGFLLLNASLVLQSTPVQKDATYWRPFIKQILDFLLQKKPNTQLILFGNIAKIIGELVEQYSAPKLYTEHPYNISFITNPKVINFFKPLHLLLHS